MLLCAVGCARGTTECPRPADTDAAIVAVGSAGADADGDGLDDNYEDALARAYLPFLAVHPDDACPRSGLVFRARPHPDADDDTLVLITYSHVFEIDCGLNGHVGDNEAFGVAIDTRVPPPLGIVSIVAVSHQGTACERTTVCGHGRDLAPCVEHDGRPQHQWGRPVLYSSKDKHAGSVGDAWGCGVGSCLDECEAPLLPADPPRVNAGEPDAPLVSTLPFITASRGWTHDELARTDAWGDDDFGGAGNIAGDLLDGVFTAPLCE